MHAYTALQGKIPPFDTVMRPFAGATRAGQLTAVHVGDVSFQDVVEPAPMHVDEEGPDILYPASHVKLAVDGYTPSFVKSTKFPCSILFIDVQATALHRGTSPDHESKASLAVHVLDSCCDGVSK